jgi:hypothetical protein
MSQHVGSSSTRMWTSSTQLMPISCHISVSGLHGLLFCVLLYQMLKQKFKPDTHCEESKEGIAARNTPSPHLQILVMHTKRRALNFSPPDLNQDAINILHFTRYFILLPLQIQKKCLYRPENMFLVSSSMYFFFYSPLYSFTIRLYPT